MQLAAVPAEPASARSFGKMIEDVPGQELGRGVHTAELRQLIQVLIVELLKHLLEHGMRAGDINDDSMRIEALRQKRDADDKRRTMHVLGGAEDLAAKGVRDHDLVGNFHRIHENAFSSVGLGSRRVPNEPTDHVRLRIEDRGELGGQLLKRNRRRNEPIKHGIVKERKCCCETSSRAPARAPRGRDSADLARQEPQSSGVKGFPERRAYLAAPIPAQLDDAGFVSGNSQRGRKASRCGARMERPPKA